MVLEDTCTKRRSERIRSLEWRALTSRNSVNTETLSAGFTPRKCEDSRTENALRFPCVTDLYEGGQLLACIVAPVNCYLVTYCQEVVVGPEGGRADRIQLD